MYVYKALVDCLPGSNKIKLASIVNQSSHSVIEPLSLSMYDFGVVCQANASYCGVILVRVNNVDQHKEFVLDHFCVLPGQRRRGYGSALFGCIKEEMKPGDEAYVTTERDPPLWKSDLLRRWGWEPVEGEEKQQQQYRLVLS